MVVEGGGGQGGDEGWMGMDPVQWFQSCNARSDLERREHILLPRPAPPSDIAAPPLTCASGLGNGDSAVPVACSPSRFFTMCRAPKIYNLTLGASAISMTS